MPAEQELIDISVKTLFNTGLFSDIRMEVRDRGVLAVVVVENPIVNQVLYEGNKKIKSDKFTEEVQLAARSVYTRAKVQADAQKWLRCIAQKVGLRHQSRQK